MIQFENLEYDIPGQEKWDSDKYSIFRTKVPGGWLVLSKMLNSASDGTMIFYPDPEHKWDGSSLD